MSRFFLFIGLPLLLVGCSLPGAQDENGVIVDNTVVYENEEISMLVPKSWSGQAITTLPIPRKGAIVTAFVSPEVKSGYANNLIVLADILDNPITSRRYSELNSLQTRKNYLEYNNILEENLTFSDSEESRVYVFEARYNESTPKMKFIQTARVCGTKVYLVHFSLGLDKKSENYIELLKSFTCK